MMGDTIPCMENLTIVYCLLQPMTWSQHLISTPYTMVVWHNIIQPYGSVPWAWNMSIILCGSSNKLDTCLLFVHSSWTWKFKWSYVAGTMCKNYCLSQKYSQETMFVLVLIPKFILIATLSLNYHQFHIAIHNILTIQSRSIHYSYRHQFLPIFQVSFHKYKIMKSHVKC